MKKITRLNISFLFSQSGQGHQRRTEALKKQFREVLKKISLTTSILTYKLYAGAQHDIIIIDAEPDKPDYKEISKHCKQLVVFFDGDIPEVPEGTILINSALMENNCDYNLYGRKYLCLNNATPILIKNFCGEVKIEGFNIESPYHEIILKDIEHGSSFQEELKEADIRITSGGQTYLEALQYEPTGEFIFPISRNYGEFKNVDNCQGTSMTYKEHIEQMIQHKVYKMKNKASTFYVAQEIMSLYGERIKI